MDSKVSLLNLLEDDRGVVSLEYLLFVAAIAIFLTVGVSALMGAMSGYFNSWVTFFNSGG
jgi:Flp pilus assembly pilin Flp